MSYYLSYFASYVIMQYIQSIKNYCKSWEQIMTDPKITSMPCWCWHTVQRKLFSWNLEFVQQVEQVQKYCHSVLKNGWLASQKFHVSVAWRFVAKIDNRVSWKWKLLWYARTPSSVWRFPKPAHSEARKARKPSLQTRCPQQQRRMLNSLLLTSLSVNSYNPVIDQFFMPLVHGPYAYEELRSKFFFLANFTESES